MGWSNIALATESGWPPSRDLGFADDELVGNQQPPVRGGVCSGCHATRFSLSFFVSPAVGVSLRPIAANNFV